MFAIAIIEEAEPMPMGSGASFKILDKPQADLYVARQLRCCCDLYGTSAKLNRSN